jgi:NitT/TauT family transport system permease protein
VKASVLRFFTPNLSWSGKAIGLAILAWIGIVAGFWYTRSPVVPRPEELLGAFPKLLDKGLLNHLYVSLVLNLQALALTTLVTLGLTFFFTLATNDGHSLKLAILVFGMTVYFLTSMADVVASIPKEKFDYARTLRMGEWRVVWEVVIRGTRDQAIETMRQNAAIGWMMLTMVEALVRSEGGIGTMLLNENKHFKLDAVFALQLVILAVGLGLDAGIGWLKKAVAPYASLKTERK